MAFANRFGNLVKNTINSTPSLFQSIRCMSSSSKVFVGGISYSTDDHSLKEAFSSYGEVVEARIIMDRETGRSRGFGFVSFTCSEDATNAISGMDGKELHGRSVRVNYANDRTTGGGGFGGGYSGGGFGGGYSGGGGYGGGGYGGGGYTAAAGGGGYTAAGGSGGYGGGGYDAAAGGDFGGASGGDGSYGGSYANASGNASSFDDAKAD